MKKTLKLLSLSFIAATTISVFAACESTSQESNSNQQTKVRETHTASSENSENSSQLKKDLQNMKIELVTTADIPVAGTAFKQPFVVSVKHSDGTPYEELKLTVKYPLERTENGYSFETAEIETNAKGQASFLPPVYSSSINSTVTFAPKAPVGNYDKLIKAVELEVPVRVRFSLVKKAILVNIVDYDQKDKMVLDSALSTSSNTMQEFWKAGYPYQAQNADFHKAIDKGPEAVYQAAKNLVGTSTYYKYIVYGKVKYASDIKEVEDGYSLTLTGTVTVIDYATGKAIYSTSKTTTVTDKNKWNILKACQVQLAKDLVNELIYSM
ncbi:hypothetical protein [Treponema sp.]|uniref:hypothetical protein n=1 Tax=Treponema sp. TaxID=166 RepID=UPI00298E6199|nr:hypothetical protein [Treponema sp.]MCR5612306.1 hypothetical protein [Treponema sp.]